MPNRFTIAQHDFIYKFIVARDGERCLACHKKPQRGRTLEIDHADNDPKNNNPDNLHLLCRPCNLKLRGKSKAEHLKLIRDYSALCVSECVSVCENSWTGERTRVIKGMAGYSGGSAEMRVNSYCEIAFRDWLIGTIKEHTLLAKDEAVNSGAEVAGCSTATTRRYLEKLTSAVGPLLETLDPTTGTKLLVLRVRK